MVNGRRFPWRTVSLSALSTHPWLRLAPSALFLVPLDFLKGISSGRGQLGTTTDIGDGTIAQVSLDDVWNGIKDRGMRDPLIIAIGLSPQSSTIRLESGNHRIFPAERDGLTHLPVIGIASSHPILNAGNGDHVFEFDRTGLDKWLTEGGRSPEYFEPYPHPVDLKATLQNEKVFSSSEIITSPKNDSGLVEFTSKTKQD